MSDIKGQGHGDCHDWHRIATHGRYSIHMECLTEYECKRCNAYYRHFYNRPGQSDIFLDMERFGVPNTCEDK